MNMGGGLATSKRTTIADEIFRLLREEIIALELLPGQQLSEAEVARKFDVSRQPVREAFLRLADLDLLEIRPQRATLVTKISLAKVTHTRFVRAALEVETVREATRVATAGSLDSLRENLEQQTQARSDNDPGMIATLDYRFHQLICIAAARPLVFDVVSEFKAHTDRICRIELSDSAGMAETIAGHTSIVNAIVDGDTASAVEMTRVHLAHLDDTIASALARFPQYFAD